MSFAASLKTGRKNEKWTPAEKDLLIHFMLDHPHIKYQSVRAISEAMSGLQIEGKTAESIVKQVAYMVRQVRLVYKNRNETGQGSLPTEVHGIRNTYGYEALIPLLYKTVPLLLENAAEELGVIEDEPGTSESHTRQDREQLETTAGEIEMGVLLEEEDPQEIEIGPQNEEEPLPTPAARASTGRQRGVSLTRTPRRIGQCTSLLQELRELQEKQDGLFLAGDATRRLELEVEAERVRVAEAEVALRRSVHELQSRRWEREMELQERVMERRFELKEKKMTMAFELERRRMELKERKFEMKRVQRDMDGDE